MSISGRYSTGKFYPFYVLKLYADENDFKCANNCMYQQEIITKRIKYITKYKFGTIINEKNISYSIFNTDHFRIMISYTTIFHQS